jgi:hypothetical protein
MKYILVGIPNADKIENNSDISSGVNKLVLLIQSIKEAVML